MVVLHQTLEPHLSIAPAPCASQVIARLQEMFHFMTVVRSPIHLCLPCSTCSWQPCAPQIEAPLHTPAPPHHIAVSAPQTEARLQEIPDGPKPIT
jgi:hypothetical protein